MQSPTIRCGASRQLGKLQRLRLIFLAGFGVDDADAEADDVAVDVVVAAGADVGVDAAAGAGTPVAGGAAVGAGSAVVAPGWPVPPRIGRRRWRVLFCGMERLERVDSAGSVGSGADAVRWRPAYTSRMEEAAREVRTERRCWR